ncbi:MAG: mevalonate kinase [Candidatus Aenigmarchaeota archaeon]|nr:mevalonate kinase [Candidatus Aenigmarchaeota archaeon]
MVKVSAPGKLLLCGDHAVVHGNPCIVTAVDHRAFVTAKSTGGNAVVVKAPDVGITEFSYPLPFNGLSVPKGAAFVIQAVKNFYGKYGLSDGLVIETASEFPSSFGLGSSSAVTVATVKALSDIFSIKMEPREIFDLSYKTVLDVQGVGSGFDVASAAYGGTLFYFTGGKIIEPLTVKKIPLIVGYTGQKADTATIVRKVDEKLKAYPDHVLSNFNLIGKIVLDAKDTIERKDWKKLGDIFNFDHGLLSGLGVSCAELEKLVFAARNAGAYGAKLSGAGGGDCMIAVSEDTESIVTAIDSAGGKVIPVRTGVEGVRIETE